MSVLRCSLSGTEPEEPVINKNTGHVYEKRLIEKYLDNSTKCPVTGDPLSLHELVPIKVSKGVKPRPPKATSIPAMLGIFQNEWDAVMLECYTLREQLNKVREELAHALYQQDAACRVIARLKNERDEAKRALANTQAQLASAQAMVPRASEEMDVDKKEMDERITQKMINLSKRLTASRKKRTIPPETATVENIRALKCTGSHPIHDSSKPGILCLDIHPRQPELVLTGGVDGKGILFNRNSQQVVATLSGHTRKVRDVLFHPERNLLFTASQDRTVRVWSEDNDNYSTTHCFKHGQEVVGLDLHPIGDYLVAGVADASWSFSDINTGSTLANVTSGGQNEPITCIQFHPDGLILGTGTVGSRIKVWDVKTLSNVAAFDGHKGSVTDISFSENGFYMASCAEDCTIKLWDLRKLKVFQTIALEGSHCSSLSFDYSGKYLVVGGDNVRIYGFSDKLLEHRTTLSDHKKRVTDVKFGKHARFVGSTSMDRTLKFYEISSLS